MGVSRAHRSFVLGAPLDVVRALLTDPTRLPALHPLIERVTLDFEGEEGGERVRRFTVEEHVPVFGIRVANRYIGEIRWAGARLRMRAWSRPSVTVDQVWELSAEGPATRVEQEVVLAEPWWTFGVAGRAGGEAHDGLVERLVAYFER